MPPKQLVKPHFNAYDLVTTIDLKPPEPIVQIDYLIEDRNNVTITWETY